MALLNYTTTIEASKTVNQIQEILVKHGARAVVTEYGKDGCVESLFFKVETPRGVLGVRLPVDPDAILKVLYKQYQQGKVPYRFSQDRPQAVRIAWRIVKDWVEAQMALLETEMVKLEQVFLPYVMVSGKQTLFQAFTEGKLLQSGPDLEGEFSEVK